MKMVREINGMNQTNLGAGIGLNRMVSALLYIRSGLYLIIYRIRQAGIGRKQMICNNVLHSIVVNHMVCTFIMQRNAINHMVCTFIMQRNAIYHMVYRNAAKGNVVNQMVYTFIMENGIAYQTIFNTNRQLIKS